MRCLQKRPIQSVRLRLTTFKKSKRTSKLLRTISGNSTSNRIHLSINSIDRTLRVPLSLGSVILRLTGSVLLLAGLCPGGSAGEVANGFDDGAFE